MPVVVPADAEQVVLARVKQLITAAVLPAPPTGKAWTASKTVPDGVTPSWFIQVRVVGGESAGEVADRALVDVRVWADGTSATEGVRSLAARTLLARIRQAIPCRVFALPVPLPDPADTSKIHTLFTIQPLLKGTQQP